MHKNIRHRRYMIRAQAAKAMLAHDMHDDLEKLLAVLESEIKGGLRAPEGAYNVMQAANVALEREPSTAVAVAEMIRQRMDSFDTDSLVTLVGTPNSGERTPNNGLYPSLSSLEGDQHETLVDLLYGVYRAEFINRLKQEGKPYNQALVDTLIDLTQLRSDISGWQPLGDIKPEERIWRFTTFDPQRERKRFRHVQMPEEPKGWQEPGFDDQAWRTGQAPIGKGPDEFRGVSIASASDWGRWGVHRHALHLRGR